MRGPRRSGRYGVPATLVLAMLLTLLTGCDGATTPDADAPSPSTSATSVAGSAAGEPPGEGERSTTGRC